MLIPEGVKRCVYGFYTMINKDEYVLPIYGIILIGCYGLNAILPAPQQLVADLGLLLGTIFLKVLLTWEQRRTDSLHSGTKKNRIGS